MKRLLTTLTSLLILLATTTLAAQEKEPEYPYPIPGIGPVGKIIKLHDGFKFTEGPAADSHGNVYFTDIPNDKIYKIDLQDKLTEFLGDSHRINGLMFNLAGTLFACQGGENRVVTIDVATHKITPLPNQPEGKDAVMPNDIVLDRTGGLYYTDPGKGVVLYRSATGETKKYKGGASRPNGVILSPDEKTLYVIPSGQPTMMYYPVLEPGKLDKIQPFCKLLQPGKQKYSGGDGATIDTKGNLYIACRRGVQVFDPTGKRLGILWTDDFSGGKYPANVTFGGPENKTLYITARGAVYKAKMEAQGHVFPGMPTK